MPRATRVRAPELVGRGGWLNTDGRPLRLADLAGRFVLLDFWTFCCINCLHVIEELRPLEEKYSDTLVIIGVHSPKFPHEADHDAVRDAVERYGVRHPVLDDPDMTTWRAYVAQAWPTLTLIDPEGYVVEQYAGEGHGHAIDALLTELVPAYDARSTLHRGAAPSGAAPSSTGALHYPGRALVIPEDRAGAGGRRGLVVADTGNQSLAFLEPADSEPADSERAGSGRAGSGRAGSGRADSGDSGGWVVRARVGTGERGFLDGPPDEARFRDPSGVCLVPEAVADEVGYDLVVADTANHALRGVRLDTGDVQTLTGTGQQWMPGDGDTALSSPWDVAWLEPGRTGGSAGSGAGCVVIAMAGVHQLWAYDPFSRRARPVAGSGHEGLEDGPAPEAWFAQPSGLAVDGSTLWLVDAETSALRRVSLPLDTGEVETAVGSGLFDFGLRDGVGREALLQHPLGLCTLPDGSIAVADTYNGALRRYDPRTDLLETLALGLAEPTDVTFVPATDGAGDVGTLLVVESAGHRITRYAWPAVPLAPQAVTPRRTPRPPLEIAPGVVELTVAFEPPPGQKLDDSEGPPTRLYVSATPPALIREGEGSSTALGRKLELDRAVGDGVLHVAAMAASCDVGAEFPVCHMHQQDWGVPVRLVEGGASEIRLVLAG